MVSADDVKNIEKDEEAKAQAERENAIYRAE
jgi:hypothetical protein